MDLKVLRRKLLRKGWLKPGERFNGKYPEQPCQGLFRIIETKSPSSTATKNGSTSPGGD